MTDDETHAPVVRSAYAGGPIYHVLVTTPSGCTAYVNPTLYALHGADALRMPGWWRGDDVGADAGGSRERAAGRV